KASMASTSVIQRCFQIVPSANHLTMRCATSSGVEKKNGGSSVTPPIGTVVRTYHSAIETIATRICKSRRLIRDTFTFIVIAGLDPASHAAVPTIGDVQHGPPGQARG